MRPVAAAALSIAMLVTTAPLASAEDAPGSVKLSIERYEELMAAARRQDGPAATWAKGDVRVTLPKGEDAFVTVDVTTRLRVIGKGIARVPMLPGEVVFETATFDGGDATLVRSGGVYVALLEENRRDVNVRLRYLVPGRGATDGAPTALVPLPPMSSSTLTIETGGVPVDVWPGANIKRAGNRVTAGLPATLGVAIRYGAGAAGSAVRAANYDLRLDASGNGIDAIAEFDVLVRGATATVQLASASTALIEVKEGNDPLVTHVTDGWHVVTLEGQGRKKVTARFRIAIDRSGGQPVVGLALTRAPITRVQTVIPGKRTITYDPAVPLTSRVDGPDDKAVTTAIGQLPPTDHLEIGWTETVAAPEETVRINSETYQLLSLEEGVMRSRVYLRYDVISGKAKDLLVEIPENVVPFKVTGDGIEDWRVYAANEELPRHVRVTLSSERDGSFQLILEHELRVTKGEDISIPVVKPLQVYRQRGVVGLINGDKVEFEPVKQTSYTEAGEDAFPTDIRQQKSGTVSQTFSYIQAPGDMTSKVVATQERELRYDAEVHTLYEAKGGAMTGRSTIVVDVKSGKLNKVVLDLPEGVILDENVSAPSSTDKAVPAKDYQAEEGRVGWEIDFTRALEGAVTINASFELRIPEGTDTVTLPDLRVAGAQTEDGAFGITAETAIEVQALPTTAGDNNLRVADAKELPNAVRLRSEREIKLAYLYSRAPWSLQLIIRRHQTVETLHAEVTRAWLETTVYEEGNIVTTALYVVANRSSQFLRLAMPAETEVLAVERGGELIKAVEDASGALAIPLKKDATVDIYVKYEARRDRLSSFGSVEALAPLPDMRVSDLQWVVRTPPELAVFGLDSSLKEVPYDEYRPPNRVMDPQAEATTDGFWQRLFTRAVYKPVDEGQTPTDDDKLTVSFNFASAGGGPLNAIVGLLALLFLALVIRRRVKTRKLGGGGFVLLILGLGLLVGKMMLWPISGGEIGLGLVVLIVVAFVTLATMDRTEAVEDRS